jgi:para-nitrobenzyl esterase
MNTHLLAGCRRLLLILVAVGLTACAGLPPAPPPGLVQPSEWDGTATVRTRYGLVRGFEDQNDTWVWKAIPYARPPSGALRWQATLAPEPWLGVRARRSFSQPCTQYRPLSGRISGSEDCLYLNIWRPRSTQGGLPVYVWIHGGGNSIGSATYVPDYYGHSLASRQNLVFVSINYRLGPFGWFTLPALREGRSAEDDSGNFGTLDLIQSLKWIQENIGAFGGDPETILIAGESAGAMNVLSLLLAPAAQGLFHRAVVESGLPVANDPWAGEERARRVLLRLLVRAGKARSLESAEMVLSEMSPQEVRAFLRAQPDRRILRCYGRDRSGMIDNPAIFADGFVLPADSFEALKRGDYPGKVPILIGSNLEEVKLFLFLAGNASWKEKLYRIAARYGSARWKADGVDGVARRLAANPDQPPVYAYLFAWGAPDEQGYSPLPGQWGQRLGAFHSLEVPFFLGTDTIFGQLPSCFLFTEGNRAGREALSASITAYLGSFLRYGDPNQPVWPSGGHGEAPEVILPYWSPWSNEPGEPKSLRLDVRGGAPDIRLLTEEASLESVETAMAAEFSPKLLAQARELLARSILGMQEQEAGELWKTHSY